MSEQLEKARRVLSELAVHTEAKKKQISETLGPLIDVFDSYELLLVRAILLLGKVPPTSRQEENVRDLIADAGDFLREARRPLLEGQVHVAFPLARRAFESTALLAACHQDAALAARWDSGKQISNSDTRRAIGKLPLGENEAGLRETYNFYSEGSHPNRSLVAERYLGDGNQFVLGASGLPSIFLVYKHLEEYLSLWFWFSATVGFLIKEKLASNDPEYGAEYLATAKKARELLPTLGEFAEKARQEELALHTADRASKK